MPEYGAGWARPARGNTTPPPDRIASEKRKKPNVACAYGCVALPVRGSRVSRVSWRRRHAPAPGTDDEHVDDVVKRFTHRWASQF